MKQESIQYAHIEAKLLNNTEKAVLVEYEEEEVWLPFSQIEPRSFREMFDEDNDLRKGVTIHIDVAEWLAKQRGLV